MTTKREVSRLVKLAFDATKDRIAEYEQLLHDQRMMLQELRVMKARLSLPGKANQDLLENIESRAADIAEGDIERSY